MSSLDVTVVVCGAPLAGRTPDIVSACLARGWRPTVVATRSAVAFLDVDAVTGVLGEAPRVDYRSPDEPKRGGDPAAVVVCPATFNTVNKAALGIADNYALGVVCEAMGIGVPLIVVPMVNNKLWAHPAWEPSLATLRRAGVDLVDMHTGGPLAEPVQSGTGTDVVAAFDPQWITRRVAAVTAAG